MLRYPFALGDADIDVSTSVIINPDAFSSIMASVVGLMPLAKHCVATSFIYFWRHLPTFVGRDMPFTELVCFPMDAKIVNVITVNALDMFRSFVVPSKMLCYKYCILYVQAAALFRVYYGRGIGAGFAQPPPE